MISITGKFSIWKGIKGIKTALSQIYLFLSLQFGIYDVKYLDTAEKGVFP